MRLLFALFVLFSVPTATLAGEGTLGDGKDKWMRPIWRSLSAMNQGEVLLQAKEQDLATRYMACFVPSGTRVVATYVSERIYRVVVREGKDRGCEGYVSRDYSPVKD
jgi:hypothetical protein